jgi:uncharacterized protein (DUF4415 family)
VSNERRVTRHSTAELLEKRAKGESLTDLARVRQKSEVQVAQDIADDPDWKDVPADWYVDAEKSVPNKQLLSIRLDTDVIDWFRQQGAGYQTRINNVLRRYMDEVSKRRVG